MSESDKNLSIIGIGRLGICMALSLDEAGYNVMGVDVFPKYVDAINARTFKSNEPSVSDMLAAASDNLVATTEVDDAINHSDTIFIAVATPTGAGEKVYDHSSLNRVLVDLNDRKVENKHIVVVCTVIPGWSKSVGEFLLRDCVNTTLSYNPEFIAQGDIINGFKNPDMVLIGEGSPEAGDRLEAIYKTVVQNDPEIHRMSVQSAEITKLSLNCFVTMKISYANQIGDIADRVDGADKNDILTAVGADSRVGKKYLKPGYGFGGPCFPRDNRALGLFAQQLDLEPMLCLATDEYNAYHTELMTESKLKELEDVDEVTFEDVAYKPNCPVNIIEESQKLVVAAGVAKAGKKVTIRDRQHIIIEVMKEYGSLFTYEIVDDF
eukprot:TRINITY_DN607_c0_g1_i7.p1 TRINITY_DN607_c0_g1~~TRINITY_DN607_c0_g1_i7.p1  ORF type:complete len:386 (-),score=128.33 TRINITY_DN607_c0_g1_i7:2597-3733(-)